MSSDDRWYETDALIAAWGSPGPLGDQPAVQRLLERRADRARTTRSSRSRLVVAELAHEERVVELRAEFDELGRKYDELLGDAPAEHRPPPALKLIQGGARVGALDDEHR